MRISQRSLLLGGLIVLFLLVGCGNNAESGSPVPPERSTASPMPGPPTPAITLQISATSYTLGSTISVTITNQGQQTVFFTDHKTNCTVLLVERQTVDSWEPVAPCKLMTATRFHSLKAGASLEVPLTTSAGQWSAGGYRAKLSYNMGSQNGPPQTALSSMFHDNLARIPLSFSQGRKRHLLSFLHLVQYIA